jgi:hypothetical protein
VLGFLANNVINPGHFLGIEVGPAQQIAVYHTRRFTA